MFHYVDLFIEPNPNTPDGCGQRFKAESEPREVSRVRFDGRVCRVSGWSPDGACEALTVLVEDSGSGTAMLVYGGEWGVRLEPEDGGAPFGEPYLLVGADAIL